MMKEEIVVSVDTSSKWCTYVPSQVKYVHIKQVKSRSQVVLSSHVLSCLNFVLFLELGHFHPYFTQCPGFLFYFTLISIEL
jgi:hypothetical protein